MEDRKEDADVKTLKDSTVGRSLGSRRPIGSNEPRMPPFSGLSLHLSAPYRDFNDSSFSASACRYRVVGINCWGGTSSPAKYRMIEPAVIAPIWSGNWTGSA